MSFFKEYSLELIGIAVGVGLSTSFVICLKTGQRVSQLLHELPVYEADNILLDHSNILNKPIGLIGNVVPEENPISSNEDSKIVGAVWKFITKQHLIAQVAGFWRNDETILNEVTKSIPFSIAGNNIKVQVSLRDLDLENVDLSVVTEKFEVTSNSSFFDLFLGYLRGVHQTGLRYTEKMLLSGTRVMGIGRLVFDKGRFLLKPFPSLPFIVVTKTKEEVIEDVESPLMLFRALAVICACGSVYCFVKLWSKRKKNRKLQELQRIIDEAREVRRLQAIETSADEVPERLQCVVCSELRDVVILPCQHVCICGSCSMRLNPRICPVCRANIDHVQPIFYS